MSSVNNSNHEPQASIRNLNKGNELQPLLAKDADKRVTIPSDKGIQHWVSRQWSKVKNPLIGKKIRKLIKDFSKDNWEIVQFGPQTLVKDRAANEFYRNRPNLRMDHLKGTLFFPTIGTLLYLGLAVRRIAFLLIGFHFWNGGFTKANFSEAGKDLLRIVATPLALIGLESALIIGLINPNNGRKLFSKIERAMSNYMAPDFYHPVALPAQRSAQS